MNIPKTESLKTTAIYYFSLGYGQRPIQARFVLWRLGSPAPTTLPPTLPTSPHPPLHLSQLLSQLGSGWSTAAFAEMGQPSPLRSLLLQQASLVKTEGQGELEHTLPRGLGDLHSVTSAALFRPAQVISSAQIQGVKK